MKNVIIVEAVFVTPLREAKNRVGNARDRQPPERHTTQIANAAASPLPAGAAKAAPPDAEAAAGVLAEAQLLRSRSFGCCRWYWYGGTSFYAAGRISLPPRHLIAAAAAGPGAASSSPSDPSNLSVEAEAELVSPLSAEAVAERAKLAQVSKKLEKTARHFKNLGTLGFWSQLVCTFVSAGILSFSAVATGNVTAPFTFCATAVGIVMAFISVFQSYGYIRLSERLKRTANEPSKAPARADVVKNLRNSIVLNVVGMAAAVLGLQATVGALVGKALTTSAVPYYQGIAPGQSPVLALDIFLVQASANTILSHFLGISSSLELLRSVTLSETEANPVPKPALRSVTLSKTEAAPVPKPA